MSKLAQYLPKINLSILMVLVFVMPIHLRFIPVLIALFGILNIVDGFVNKTFSFSHKKIIITGLLFFFIHLISVFYSDNKAVAWFDIEIKLSLLVFPIIFLFKNSFIIERKRWVLISFVLGTIVSSIIMLLFAYYRFDGVNSHVFYYAELSLFHPSYMAMYFIFSILIIIRIMDKDLSKLNHRLIAYSIILFLLILISLLQSKAGILSIIAISFYYIVFAFIRSKALMLRISFFVLAVSVSLIFVQKNNRLQTMANAVEKISDEGRTSGSTGIRFSMWKVTIQEIPKYWIFGVGSGDIKEVLFKRYEEEGLTEAIEGNYNVHNQYLETFFGQGIIGISLLLLLLFFGIQEALKKKELILSGYIILITLSMGPESMLNSQMGVVFISFFYYFLFVFDIPNDEKNSIYKKLDDK